MTKKDWIAAVFVLLTFVFFVVAFFQASEMSGEQLQILRFLASASAGFAGLLFAGKASFQGEGVLPVVGKVTLVGTASFALFFVVWFSFGSLDESFVMTVRVFDGQGQPVGGGDITLHFGQDTRAESVAPDGEATFKGIPSAVRGDSSRVIVAIPGYVLSGPEKIHLSPDNVPEITMSEVEEPLSPLYLTVGTSLWNSTYQRSDPKSSRHYLQIDCGTETVRTDRFFKGTYFLAPERADRPPLQTAAERGAFFDELHAYLSRADGGQAGEASGTNVDEALQRWTSQDSTIVCAGLQRGGFVEIELRIRRQAGPDSVLAWAREPVADRHPSQAIILEASP